jgi:hypothetical protein
VPDPSRPTRWWIAPVLGVVVVVTAVSALVAHNLYDKPPTALTPPRVVVPSATSSVPPSAEPGSPIVTVTPDVEHFPLHNDIQPVLQTYFDAINDRSYTRWRSVVSRKMAESKPLSQFITGYETSIDGSILVYRVDTELDDSLRVLVRFHSTQDRSDAPPDFQHGCIVWYQVFPLTFDTDAQQWKIDAGTTSRRQTC